MAALFVGFHVGKHIPYELSIWEWIVFEEMSEISSDMTYVKQKPKQKYAEN